jgi:WW domain-binding protein 4
LTSITVIAMSEYWVSKKKYFCKYCEIYIADDAPSRNHHESGMRHKGNLERYIRGIYKQGVQKKKDLEEEKREMARVEKVRSLRTIFTHVSH